MRLNKSIRCQTYLFAIHSPTDVHVKISLFDRTAVSLLPIIVPKLRACASYSYRLLLLYSVCYKKVNEVFRSKTLKYDICFTF